jgi:hypothetical protein
MFSAKCVNPDCLADFDHRRGRIFRFHERLGGDAFEDTCAVRHFWLCEHCSQLYALEYVQGVAVLVGLEWLHAPQPTPCLPERPYLNQLALSR